MTVCGHCGFQSNDPSNFMLTTVGHICDACYQRATLTQAEAQRQAVREVGQFQSRVVGWPVLSLLLSLIWLHLTTLSSFNPEAWIRLIQWGCAQRDALVDGELHRLFTSTWLHGGYHHWLGNSTAFCIIGAFGERYLGRGRYLAAWIVAGVGGALASAFIGSHAGGSIGASGAITGLVACLAVYSLRGKQSRSVGHFSKLTFGLVVFLVADNVLRYLFTGIVPHAFPPISYAGHFGGLITGALMGLILPHRRDDTHQRSMEAVHAPGVPVS